MTEESNQTRNINAHILAMGKKFNSDIEALTHVSKHFKSKTKGNKAKLDGRDMTLQHYMTSKGMLEFVIPGVTDDHDWSVEPTETIEQLCDRLCEVIEQTYDEIIIGYSGGTDSETIAQYFLRRGTRNVTLLKRPQDLWPGHEIDNAKHFFNGTLQWADKITAEAIKTKYSYAFKNLGWKMQYVKHLKPYDEAEYEKSLANREFLCYECDYNNVNSWAQNSGQTMFNTKGKKSCFIEGLEKPIIILHKGWYKFHMNHDSQWWGQPFAPPGTDRIWFWLNSLVPDVIRKLAHLKAKEIKKIFKEKGIAPTADEVKRMNDNSHPTRMRILRAMRMTALTPFHYTGYATHIECISTHFGPLEFIPTAQEKDFDWKNWEISLRSQLEHRQAVNKNLIRDRFYDEIITKKIHHRFLNKEHRTLYGISSKLFPVIPAIESDDS